MGILDVLTIIYWFFQQFGAMCRIEVSGDVAGQKVQRSITLSGFIRNCFQCLPRLSYEETKKWVDGVLAVKHQAEAELDITETEMINSIHKSLEDAAVVAQAVRTRLLAIRSEIKAGNEANDEDNALPAEANNAVNLFTSIVPDTLKEARMEVSNLVGELQAVRDDRSLGARWKDGRMTSRWTIQGRHNGFTSYFYLGALCGLPASWFHEEEKLGPNMTQAVVNIFGTNRTGLETRRN